MTQREQRIGRRTTIACVAFSVLAFLLAYASPVEYTLSDPWGTLLTAQAILEHGTVQLDAYAGAPVIADLDLAWQRRGHLYTFFPVGTSVLTVPAVWLARLAGRDMAVSADNSALQTLLSALTVALAFPLIFVLCRFFVSSFPSLLLAAAFVFGSSTLSTLGTALWSSNLTFLFNLLVLVLLVRDRYGSKTASPYLLGLLLFCSYFCRPTAALLILITFAYLGSRRRALLLRTALGFALPSAAFVLFSLAEYESLLPPYYAASRLGAGDWSTGLFGNLLSPSRGLLILCPYLALPLLGGVVWFRRVEREDFFALGLIWAAAHWFVISLYPNWWGAWSFGNRLFADALPAAILLTATVARAGLESCRGNPEAPPARAMKLAAILFAALTAAAVYIHGWKGLFDLHPYRWCQDGTYVHHLFDWRHPQFLASASNLEDHRRRHVLPHLSVRSLEEPITPASSGVIFAGWSRPVKDGTCRWSRGTPASLLFKLEPELPGAGPLSLEIVADTYRAQRIPLRVNGVEVGNLASTGGRNTASYAFELDRQILETNHLPLSDLLMVEIELSIAETPAPADLDRRLLGLCLRQLTLRASE